MEKKYHEFKQDEGKLQWHLLPTQALEGAIKVQMYGNAKYDPNTWHKVPDAKVRYYDALFRHLLAWKNGEVVDKESGLRHLDHAVTNVLFLSQLDFNNQGFPVELPEKVLKNG